MLALYRRLQCIASTGILDRMERATKRPADFAKPRHWSNEPPPEAAPARPGPKSDKLDPTRYGDWEKNGIAIDF